jgi:hypothetical protein
MQRQLGDDRGGVGEQTRRRRSDNRPRGHRAASHRSSQRRSARRPEAGSHRLDAHRQAPLAPEPTVPSRARSSAVLRVAVRLPSASRRKPFPAANCRRRSGRRSLVEGGYDRRPTGASPGSAARRLRAAAGVDRRGRERPGRLHPVRGRLVGTRRSGPRATRRGELNDLQRHVASAPPASDGTRPETEEQPNTRRPAHTRRRQLSKERPATPSKTAVRRRPIRPPVDAQSPAMPTHKTTKTTAAATDDGRGARRLTGGASNGAKHVASTLALMLAPLVILILVIKRQ